MPRLFRVFVVLSFVVLSVAFSPLEAVQKPAAGWAQVDITPPLGIAMGGRGGNYVLARQVLDPLYAQVTLLEDAKGTRMALVSLDLVGLPHSLSHRLRQSIVCATGAEWSLVLLNASHTHSGPNMLRELLAGVGPAPEIEVKYFEFLHDQVVSAARSAERSLRHVDVQISLGTSKVGINRRGRNKQGAVGILPDPKGYIDETLAIIRLIPRSGGKQAVLFSYACHPVIVYGYAAAAISADFPGVARKEIVTLAPEVEHAQFLQGFGGNIRPRAVANLEKGTFSGGSDAALQQCGKELACDVIHCMRSQILFQEIDLAGGEDRPFLQRGEPPLRSVYQNMTNGTHGVLSEYNRNVASFWLKRYDKAEGFAKGEPWPLGLVRLNHSHYIVHMGGEPVAEWGDKVRSWIPAPRVITLGYTQEAVTYLPTEKMLPEGGYEVIDSNRARITSPAPFAYGIEHAMESSLRRLSISLKADPAVAPPNRPGKESRSIPSRTLREPSAAKEK